MPGAAGDRASVTLGHRSDHGGARAAQLQQDTDAELVRHLVRQAPSGFLIGTLAVVGIIAVLWTAAPRGVLLVWFLSMVVLTLPAFLVVWRFTRAPQLSRNVGSSQRLLSLVYGLAGAGWGLAAVLLYPRVAVSYQVFLMLVLGGAGLSGMAGLAPVRAAFAAYLTATFLPMVGLLIADGSLSTIATAVLLLMLWGTTLAMASAMHALTVRSVKLRFENLELIDDLSKAKDDAEAASRTKSLFLANVSHELRTPLSLILGPTRRALGSADCATSVRRDLETVERNAQALLKRVNDLLDVAKLEAGRMELHPARIDLAELVRRTASLFEVLARDRDVALVVQAPNALYLRADADKLERVVLNLLSNAMKFVPDHGRVGIALVPEGDDVVVLSVEDNGPGVPEELRQAIFERFRQGDDSITRRFGGTGLGLAIAKELVERHGGRIAVTDGADGGALFRVKLPAEKDASAVPARAPDQRAADVAQAGEPQRETLDEVARETVAELQPRSEPMVDVRGNGTNGLVLLVEDNPEMSRFIADCLTPEYRVATAFDGRQGLDKAVELRPDVVVTDVMMPVMSGDVLVRELRARPELESVPIILLTAKADDELRVRLLREGAQDFITKPVAPEELRARVANFVMVKRARDVLQHALSSRSHDLAVMADQLAAASRAKDEFLAVLSHELRAPLTPIIAWSSLVEHGKIDAETMRRAVEIIGRNARLQARIVEDLLDVSRAISGKLHLDVRPMDLDGVIYAAIDSVRPAAEAKGIQLDVALGAETDGIPGDPERLQQVVWNLVSNAVKFTPSGGRVTVRLARVGSYVELTIRDTGVGINPAFLPRLFDRFSQADSSITRTHGGLGLGLAVVRHLVELHGGTVRADSEGEGRGATFTVTLPLLSRGASRDVVAPRVPVSEDATGGLQGRKVLVVDDDRDTCDVIGTVLKGAGAEVRTCLSASQALGVLDTWVPDILVSDIGMPGEDGYTLIRTIRARKSEEGGRMAAVALTAYGQSDDRLKALSAGFQVHVGKPIEPSQLVRAVASVTRSAKVH